MSLAEMVPLGVILGRHLETANQDAQRMAARFQFLSACELARQIAAALDVTEREAFDSLTFAPDNMLSLLGSPEGWTILAVFVASDLGRESAQLAVAIH